MLSYNGSDSTPAARMDVLVTKKPGRLLAGAINEYDYKKGILPLLPGKWIKREKQFTGKQTDDAACLDVKAAEGDTVKFTTEKDLTISGTVR